MSTPAHLKSLIAPLRKAMAEFSEDGVRAVLGDVLADTAHVRLSHPLGEMAGAALYDNAFAPLFAALPDLERRDLIVVAGNDGDGGDWVGCMGHYMGTFAAPFLDIPPTGHLAHMRFHEFFRLDGGRIVEMQAIWDLPELMMQAGAWPMVPSLGREVCVPGPMTQDGLSAHDPGASQASHDLVIDMLTQLSRHPSQGGPEIMQAERFWHPRMNWYGPAGIGTARGLAGFRNWHQIPFLNALPDRTGGTSGPLNSHFFAEGNFVAVTGWPNMQMSVTGNGWLGIAPAGQKITMKSLDFWRIEGGLIRENWVLVDLLDVYAQLGVDVFSRLREFNKARVPGRIPFPIGAA
ncbi:ester cyclase [Aliiroseovarius subalbicans]|uniref:ester cyclase n=1 Tax=Aliiroseovarius subalbicans TaxID=2925840 RepID=UPI001F5ADBAE|nr:ester cyclase [Aliiroseovarius subalbicans]MCI2401132.1 ester cyclase [Aliiroseovarius subalbicans]